MTYSTYPQTLLVEMTKALRTGAQEAMSWSLTAALALILTSLTAWVDAGSVIFWLLLTSFLVSVWFAGILTDLTFQLSRVIDEEVLEVYGVSRQDTRFLFTKVLRS